MTGENQMHQQNVEYREEEYKAEFTPNARRAMRLMLKNMLLHPILFFRTLRKHDNLEDHLDEYAHRVSFGRTDHPLDDMGPLASPFSVIPKMIFRKSHQGYPRPGLREKCMSSQ